MANSTHSASLLGLNGSPGIPHKIAVRLPKLIGNLVIYILSFLIVYYLKYKHLNITASNWNFLIIYLIAWAAGGLISGKFRYQSVTTLQSCLSKCYTSLLISAITIVSVIFIIINYPFDQSTIYHYKPGRWSHVIYGRMISSIAVVLLLYLMWIIDRGKISLLPKKLTTFGQVRDMARQAKEERRRILLLVFIISIAVYGTYLSAFRAGFVGLLLVGGGLLLYSVWFFVRSAWLKQKDRYIITKNEEPAYRSGRLRTQKLSGMYSLLIIIFISSLLIILLPKPDIINFRFDNMTALDNLQFKGDPAIHSRLDYWNLSLEIIKVNPLIGVGMGGFSSYHKVEIYPHNIILEFAVEGGIVGLLVLSSLFVVMFKASYRYSECHPELVSGSDVLLFTFFLFALWLSMFSKEFSNQTVLWIGLAFVGLKRAD